MRDSCRNIVARLLLLMGTRSKVRDVVWKTMDDESDEAAEEIEKRLRDPGGKPWAAVGALNFPLSEFVWWM